MRRAQKRVSVLQEDGVERNGRGRGVRVRKDVARGDAGEGLQRTLHTLCMSRRRSMHL